MKGHRTFRNEEVSSIRRILTELRSTDPNTQKRLRNRLRDNYNFYISDFDRSGKGFTDIDLDRLINIGEIEIKD